MIITCVLAKVWWLLTIVPLAFNSELQNNLFLFSSVCQHESFFALCSCPFILAIVNIDLSFNLLRDDQAAAFWTLWVVYINHQIGHFSGQEEVFRHYDLHSGFLIASQTNILVERYGDIEARIVYYWAHWRDMHTLSRPNLTLSPTVVNKVMAYWYDLSFEEVA